MNLLPVTILNNFSELTVVYDEKLKVIYVSPLVLEELSLTTDNCLHELAERATNNKDFDINNFRKNSYTFTTNIINAFNKQLHTKWSVSRIDRKQYLLLGESTLSSIAHALEIQQLEQKVEEIIQSIAGNHWQKDIHGVYINSNKAFLETVGLKSVDDIIGKTDYELPWKQTAHKLIENDNLVISSGKTLQYEEYVDNVEGKTMTFLVTKVPMRNNKGEIIGTLGSSTDITKLKKTTIALEASKQAAEAANQAKSTFLATMSHELRTPLNGILGMVQILLGQQHTTEDTKMLNVIANSGHSLLALVNDILDFSKLEKGKIRLRENIFSIIELIDDACTSLTSLIDSENVKLIINYDKDIPPHIVGDRQRCRQVIINLLSNAIKFTEKGSIIIEARTAHINTNRVTIKYIIKDTGIGIPVNKINSIFDRFTQVESDYNRRHDGAGLGLAITKHLVEQMQGCISVKSTINRGTEFTVELPYKISSSDTKKQKDQQPQPQPQPIPTLHAKLLVVEDNLINQKVISAFLQKTDCNVDFSDTGKEALKKCQQHTYDLILMDLSLPDMDGITVTQQLLQQTEKPIPTIIALTAHVLEEDKQKCLDAGMQDVLTKPLSQDKLFDSLSNWLCHANNQERV